MLAHCINDFTGLLLLLLLLLLLQIYEEAWIIICTRATVAMRVPAEYERRICNFRNL
jgi:hypothetical protein